MESNEALPSCSHIPPLASPPRWLLHPGHSFAPPPMTPHAPALISEAISESNTGRAAGALQLFGLSAPLQMTRLIEANKGRLLPGRNTSRQASYVEGIREKMPRLAGSAERGTGRRNKRRYCKGKSRHERCMSRPPCAVFRRRCHALTLFSQRATCTAESKEPSPSCTNSDGHSDTNTHTETHTHTHRFAVKGPRGGDCKCTQIGKKLQRAVMEEERSSEAAGIWAGLSDWRKCWCAGLQVNARRRLPAGCLRQAWALLLYHLGDKSSTDSQLIFNTAQTTRHSAAVHMPTRGEQKQTDTLSARRNSSRFNADGIVEAALNRSCTSNP